MYGCVVVTLPDFFATFPVSNIFNAQKEVKIFHSLLALNDSLLKIKVDMKYI